MLALSVTKERILGFDHRYRKDVSGANRYSVHGVLGVPVVRVKWPQPSGVPRNFFRRGFRQEFLGGFNKLSLRQRAERTEIWGL
jgi:hypothetical protein